MSPGYPGPGLTSRRGGYSGQVEAAGPQPGSGATLRLAAAGDVHAHEGNAARLRDSFAKAGQDAQLILLAGDVTSTGDPAEARFLADAIREVTVPVVAVLGNHDWHRNGQREIAATLQDAGAAVLERDATILNVASEQVGVCGLKGFVGGFGATCLPDFGEPLLREVYAATGQDVEALDRGLTEIATCRFRIVLLHYSPVAETLKGEPPEIWVFLGSERLAAPIREHRPDLVLHGHAHAGELEGEIADVPVYNVSIPVTGRDFWSIELTGSPVAGIP
jgi:Icc-related predicted phosphoesterase